MIYYYLPILFFNLLLVASCGYAAGRGGAPEKVTAGLLIIAALCTALVPLDPMPSRFRHTEIPILTIDLALLGALFWIAAVADRFWPIWVAAIQLFTVATHFARALNPLIWSKIYWLVTSHAADLILLLLALGTLRHQARLRTGGVERDWSRQRR